MDDTMFLFALYISAQLIGFYQDIDVILCTATGFITENEHIIN